MATDATLAPCRIFFQRRHCSEPTIVKYYLYTQVITCKTAYMSYTGAAWCARVCDAMRDTKKAILQENEKRQSVLNMAGVG